MTEPHIKTIAWHFGVNDQRTCVHVFLGLTHVWGKSRNGRPIVRQVTAKSRRVHSAVRKWLRQPLPENIMISMR